MNENGFPSVFILRIRDVNIKSPPGPNVTLKRNSHLQWIKEITFSKLIISKRFSVSQAKERIHIMQLLVQSTFNWQSPSTCVARFWNPLLNASKLNRQRPCWCYLQQKVEDHDQCSKACFSQIHVVQVDQDLKTAYIRSPLRWCPYYLKINEYLGHGKYILGESR